MNLETAKALSSPLNWNEDNLKSLTIWEESTILRPVGLTLSSYGTERMISKSGQSARRLLAPIPVGSNLSFGVELLPTDLAYLALDQGAELSKYEDLNQAEIMDLFRSAFKLVSKYSSALFHSLNYLLKSIHIIDSPGPGIDVSFSLPTLPNSIFVSIPMSEEINKKPRLAEAIIHEVLHLQLTLVECTYPIINREINGNMVYSPWRDELRPEIGVVHAIFVFRNLEIFWSQINQGHNYIQFAQDRCKEIAEQFSSLSVSQFKSLTPFGKYILDKLLEGRGKNQVE